MNEDDYRALIDLVFEELTRSGAPEIADERNYTRTDPETGETELYDPMKRLIEMLRAFERHVATQDRSVAETALAVIRRAGRGDGPARATVVLADDGGPREIDLADAPDYSQVRKDITRIINRLMEDGFRYEVDG